MQNQRSHRREGVIIEKGGVGWPRQKSDYFCTVLVRSKIFLSHHAL